MDTESYGSSLATVTELAVKMGDLLATRVRTAGHTPQEVAEMANDLTSPWRVAFDTYNVTGEKLWADIMALPEYLRVTALCVAIEQAAVHFYNPTTK
jgi:hypothetical protein